MQLRPTVEESGVIGDFLVDIFPIFADEDEVPDDERVQEGVLCSDYFIIILCVPPQDKCIYTSVHRQRWRGHLGMVKLEWLVSCTSSYTHNNLTPIYLTQDHVQLDNLDRGDFQDCLASQDYLAPQDSQAYQDSLALQDSLAPQEVNCNW